MNNKLTDRAQLEKAWAFAKRVPVKSTRKRLAAKRYSVITACSYQAKLLGIRAGMRVGEAKLLVPELKILVTGGGRA